MLLLHLLAGGRQARAPEAALQAPGRRELLLAIGYLGMLAGAALTVASGDPGGYALFVAGVLGMVFLYRAAIHLVIWAGITLLGLLQVAVARDWSGLALVGVGAAELWVVVAAVAGQADLGHQRSPAQPGASATAFTAGPRVTEALPTAVAGSSVAPLEIGLVGELRVFWQGQDVTADLVRKPVTSFIWLYLLVRALLGLGPVARPELAREAFAAGDRMARLRGFLRDRRKLPDGLGARIAMDARGLGFDLEGVETDVRRLRLLRERARGGGGMLPGPLLEQVQTELARLGVGETLPDWEERAERLEARGVAGDHVLALRREVDESRRELAAALARTLLALGQPGQAVLALARARQLAPESPDLVRLMVRAYLECGEVAQAAELEGRFASGEVD